MTKYLLPAIIFCVALCVGAAAQSVVITPKKTVYTRPKSIQDFKKTFTVTYPKVKAATPALSKKIETTISYLKVLQLNVREEITDVQWLEEADYKVDYNARGILVITLSMNGTGAYPDGTSKTVVVNLKNGNRITPAEAFKNTSVLVDLILKKQKAEIDAAIVEMRKDPDVKDTDPAELFAEEKFTIEDLAHFAIDDSGVTFIYDYGFPHVIEALEPEGRYKFTWSEISKLVKFPVGPFAPFIDFYMQNRKIRVLVAKPGLDGHDRGAKVIARALRDAGMEVIYTGLRQTPEMIATAALQEDVDAVGISILSGAHRTLCPRIVDLLRENGMTDTLVLVGGIVPDEDIPALKLKGVSEVFLPGTSTEDIVKFINANVREQN